MHRFRSIIAPVLCLMVVAAALAAQQDVARENGRARRIAMFGSSVPNGTGDELGREGYTGRLRELLAPRGWEVLNQSRGGDTTARLAERFDPGGAPSPNTRYLTPVNPGYAVIALSLGNEGIKTNLNADAERIFEQYAAGLKAMIERCRARGIVPIVTLAYTRADFGPREHEAVRRMNLLINSWDVPSVNLLGAIDDGYGRWAVGFEYDNSHPNAAGHQEMFHAFVPSLFDALAAGKPIPTRSTAKGFARLRSASGSAPLAFEPQDTVRSFAVGLQVRARGDGTIAVVTGETLDTERQWKRLTNRSGEIDYLSYALTPSGSRFEATIEIADGRWVYRSANGDAVVSGTSASDGAWHHVVLSHSVVQGETFLYLDGALVGSVEERLQPGRFGLGGAAPSEADYRDWMVYRSALNADEVKALAGGKMLQASLEIYAPLADARFVTEQTVENRAQSMSAVTVMGDGLMHAED